MFNTLSFFVAVYLEKSFQSRHIHNTIFKRYFLVKLYYKTLKVLIHWAYLFKYSVCIKLILLILSSTCALYLCIMSSTFYCNSIVKKLKGFMASDKKNRWKKKHS